MLWYFKIYACYSYRGLRVVKLKKIISVEFVVKFPKKFLEKKYEKFLKR